MATINYSFENVVDEFVVNATIAEDQNDAHVAVLGDGISLGCAA